MEASGTSRLYCSHHKPANVDCAECRSREKDYNNRPLYAPLYIPLPKLANAVDNSQLTLPNTFYVRPQEDSKNTNNNIGDYVEIKTNKGVVHVPRSSLIHQSRLDGSNKENGDAAQRLCFNDFQNRAHRFTRSFTWKTKPEESPFSQMQPLPKLIKKPGYLEICFKNICWPSHQLCLCCARNTAQSCRKWSKSSGEYDYIDVCWSSCALCSDDAYKIFNTPIVYHEKIIDPELLLPLDAELLYYSIQSTKRQQEKQHNSSATTMPFVAPPVSPKIIEKPSTPPKPANDVQPKANKVPSKVKLPTPRRKSKKSKTSRSRKVKSSKGSRKSRKSSKPSRKKTTRTSKKKSRTKSSRSRSKSKQSRSRSKTKSKSRASRKKSQKRSRRKPRLS